jgi:hypothetical protein
MLLFLACTPDATLTEPPVCDDAPVTFGVPNAATGLDTSSCTQTCSECGGAPWTQPEYSAADHADWRAWTLVDPPVATLDPYETLTPTAPGADAVCAVHLDGGTYTLADYASTTDALAAGAQVTHYGTCGACSTLADLAVYAEVTDLTEPVRACGLADLNATVEELTACIAAIGFTDACATIWAYNTIHTREVCLAECIEAIDAPYNEPDGTLNACLQCDEDQSGEVFRAVAGRTRRNTGLASSICRPCSEVRPLEHRYGGPAR